MGLAQVGGVRMRFGMEAIEWIGGSRLSMPPVRTAERGQGIVRGVADMAAVEVGVIVTVNSKHVNLRSWTLSVNGMGMRIWILRGCSQDFAAVGLVRCHPC